MAGTEAPLRCCGVQVSTEKPIRKTSRGGMISRSISGGLQEDLGTRSSSKDDRAKVREGAAAPDKARLGELHFLRSVRPGEWAKTGEVSSILALRMEDREVCREAARAAEAIASQDPGLDALADLEVVPRLAQVWQRHQNDTEIAVRVTGVAARYWQRAGKDLGGKLGFSWFLRPACQAVGRALADTGNHEWLIELHRMAVLLHQKGLLTSAEDTYKLAIERFEASLGPAHPNTLQAQNNYAVLLEERQLFDDAEKLHRTVRDQCESSLGTSHPDTLSSEFNLAVLKQKQGQMAEAEKLYSQVLTKREKTLGEDHMDTLRARNNLAGLFKNAGRLQEAEAELRRVAERQKGGPEQPDLKDKARCSLALILAEQDDQVKRLEAETILREVLQAREDRLCGNMAGLADALRTLSHLAVVLEVSKPAEARSLHDQVLLRLDAAVSEEKKRARPLHSEWVQRLEGQGEAAKAEAMLRQVAERRLATLGPDNVDTLSSQAELAALLVRRGAGEEAEVRLREVARRCEAAQGPDHIDTLAAKAALAAALRRGERGSEPRLEANAIYSDVLSRFDDALGQGRRQSLEGASGKKMAILHRE